MIMLTLYDHQKKALSILKRMEQEGKGGIFADEMGLGKTITTLVHLKNNKIEDKSDLIVCPVSLTKHWKNEIKRVYLGLGCNKPKILLYHGKNRAGKISGQQWEYVITTYSVVGTGELNHFRWGRVVLDESHYIKNGLSSKKPKCAQALYEIGKRSKYNLCVSGTPFNNRMKDIASQCKFIGTKPYDDPAWWTDKKGGKDPDKLREWREKFLLRRTKDNIMQPPVYHDIEVTPTDKEVHLVEKLRARAHKKFEQWKKSTGLNRITLQGQILGLIQKLRVVCDSYYCGENEFDVDKLLDENSKVREMIELLDIKVFEDPTNSVVVFSQFTSYLDILKKVIESVMVGVEVMKFNGSMSRSERDRVVHNFTTSKHPRILLISLLAGGCGLNLMPCSTVFLSEPYYNPFIEKQAEERVHRLGQKNRVNVYRFNMTNSVETWVNGLKQRKMYMASELSLLCKHDGEPMDFSFSDLSELFSDFVGFKNDEKPKKRQQRNEKCSHKNIEPVFVGIDCSICLEDIGKKEPCNLQCGHIFHYDCLYKWKAIKDTCPLCKRPISIF